MKTIKLLITDDHAIVRKGLLALFEDESDLVVVAEASNGQEAIEQVALHSPDVVLLDISMPVMTGIEAAREISERYPKSKTLIFSMHHNQDYVVKAVESGAAGYLLKDMSREEILQAIRKVASGDKYFPSSVASLLAEALLNKSKPSVEEEKKLAKLSKKERQILKFLADGLSSQEIADTLNLSVRTVSNHRANIIRKTKAKNTAELVKMAVTEQKI
ncbi:MAG: response regulator transcription factor [Spirosomataceae bacterium]